MTDSTITPGSGLLPGWPQGPRCPSRRCLRPRRPGAPSRQPLPLPPHRPGLTSHLQQHIMYCNRVAYHYQFKLDLQQMYGNSALRNAYR